MATFYRLGNALYRFFSADRLLVKAARYDQSQSRTDAKGRVWEFNATTRRWRLQQQKGASPKQSKRSASAEPAKPAASMQVDDSRRAKKSKGKQWNTPSPKAAPSKRSQPSAESAATIALNSKTAKPRPKQSAGGAIVHQPVAEEKHQQTQQDRITEKYASPTAGDREVEGWIKESLNSVPDDADIHRWTVNEMKLEHGIHESFLVEDVHGYADIQSKADWMQAVLNRERSKTYTADDFAFWDGGKEIETMRKRSTSPRASEAGRAKALKRLQALERNKERTFKIAQDTADRMNARNQIPVAQRLQQLSGLYDQQFEKLKAKAMEWHQAIKAGDKVAYQKAFRRLVSNLPNYSILSDRTPEETVKEFLRHQASGSPQEVLGLPKQFDMNQLRLAYRQRARETHPDRGGNEQDFRRVTEAYQKLLPRVRLQKSILYYGNLYAPIAVDGSYFLIR